MIAELANLGFAKGLGARWNGTEYELRFPNGSLIMFRYAETVQDATRRQGGQYQLLIFDERTLTPPDVCSFLESRLRSGRRDIPVLGIRSGSNPGGPGHGAVKNRYIKPTNYGNQVVTDIRGRTVRFIPSKLSDNPHVNPEYAMDLLALDGKLRAAFLDGDWDVFAGMMFPELKRERHVIEPLELPATWRRYNGIDWGFAAPWAVLWAAVDEDGRVWIYRELYQRQVGEAEQARRILAAEASGEHVAGRYADDAMWATRGDAKPIASVYADNGVPLTPAGKGPGSRINGWQRVHSYLAEAPACPHHRAQGWDTCPRLHLFSTVTELYRELSDLPHATKGDPEDADSSADDHACLVAGTLVETDRGSVPIERVAAGDRVWTRQGLRPVKAAGLTARAAEVGVVIFSDGTILRGTRNHPVWVEGFGWKRLDDLCCQDKILTWQQLTASSSEASHSADTQTLKIGLTVRTSRPESRTVNAESSGSTRRYGRQLTGLYPRATTSTTVTRIRSTTASTTWSASPGASTSNTTWHTETTAPPSGLRNSKPYGRSLQSGTALKPVESGIGKTEWTLGRSGNPYVELAISAGEISPPSLVAITTGSARIIASRNGEGLQGSTTKTDSAVSAERFSGSTSTPKLEPAHAYVARSFVVNEQRADVYNLTVDDVPEFFAAGVLVHNCDSLRYLLINLGGGPEFPILDAAVQPDGSPEILQPLGGFAARPPDQGGDWWNNETDDDGPVPGGTVQAP